jgi:RNA polymerase sigma-70 factor, ECF subfamily
MNSYASPSSVIVPDSEAEDSVQDLVARPVNNAPYGPLIPNPVSEQTDEQLMVAFARGQTDAFNVLFARYKQQLFGFFRRRLDDSPQAEELTQETFLAVLRGTGHYQASALFRTWLYAIGFRILRAHRRKSAFRSMFTGAAPPNREPAERDHLYKDVLMRQAVGKLERMDREVLLLREFEQLSYFEIATLLRVPVNTVRSRLFRARMELRNLLSAPASVSGPQELTQSEERA